MWIKIYIVGAQKRCLIEVVLLSTKTICDKNKNHNFMLTIIAYMGQRWYLWVWSEFWTPGL